MIRVLVFYQEVRKLVVKESKLFNQELEQFVSSIRAGREREIARAITLLEDQDPLSSKIMQLLYQNYSKGYLIGITGPAGSGKSSLLNLLVKEYLKKTEEKIAVIAVDPTAQQSGGAFLGDRIRMKELYANKQIFIRSMASRESLGGVNAAVYDTAVILAAAGYQKVIIETVGVGQTEIDIVSLTDTTIVVTVPETGDEIQIYKSQLIEIGDIFILNKSDLPQAAKMELLLKSLFALEKSDSLFQKRSAALEWEKPLLKTSALNNQGIAAVVEAINEHFNYLQKNNILAENKNKQLKKHLLNLLLSRVTQKFSKKFKEEAKLEDYLAKILVGEAAPFQLIEEFVDNNLTN
ncbi:LAO/AO transport system kinase [Halanaerobium saccharolyticum]|uniref:LAO/AO transport system kinase n=1 Tax=Halanaerobium saccharolyticum TaxID=43595 RepID=A0A2T5RGP9_9FIRM|nr:methylmalonyl Co-A mutase-associated GTPase MeaB [Halanaerobium saccharolyticum]PTV93940.1 LAO/AO transport system kinase [Halanaerobium saccharolyticum]TDP93088.1 LAO/AO transport system kinase [Halanaerobium saccharolyticum]